MILNQYYNNKLIIKFIFGKVQYVLYVISYKQEKHFTRLTIYLGAFLLIPIQNRNNSLHI